MAMQETLSQISQEVKERRLPPKSRQAQDAARNMMMALLLQDVLGIQGTPLLVSFAVSTSKARPGESLAATRGLGVETLLRDGEKERFLEVVSQN